MVHFNEYEFKICYLDMLDFIRFIITFCKLKIYFLVILLYEALNSTIDAMSSKVFKHFFFQVRFYFEGDGTFYDFYDLIDIINLLEIFKKGFISRAPTLIYSETNTS